MKTQTEAYRASEEEAARFEHMLSKVGRHTSSWLVNLWFADEGTPNSPQRVQEIYARRCRWMWRRAIVRSVVALGVGGVGVPLLLLTVDRFDVPPTVIWPVAATFALFAATSVASALRGR